MSISPRTTTTFRAVALLPAIQHSTLETIEHGETIEDRLETREKVDRRSDAHFHRALLLVQEIKHSPQHAREYARLVELEICKGLELDEIEDEHCDAAISSAVAVQDLGRGTVARLAEHWGGKGTGA